MRVIGAFVPTREPSFFSYTSLGNEGFFPWPWEGQISTNN